MSDTERVLEALREATRGTEYDGRLFLVGGYVRDRVMGQSSAKDDIDIVLEGDALALAQFLRERGIAEHRPVEFPRFGTTKVAVHGRDIEIVTARVESYSSDSRKPNVQPGTLTDDAKRRDFTINTLLQSLDTDEIIDPLGLAYSDIGARVLRTPADPHLTFQDDPLRMLRAVRFAARFDFTIDPFTWKAIRQGAGRLSDVSAEGKRVISYERIRDEFCKTLLTSRAALGMNLLCDSGLLAQFAPELITMIGVTQNEFHAYPVWEHTLIALDNLPSDAPLPLRLATLLHDVGKPKTRTVEADGRVHFYGHQDAGAELARRLLQRLKFANDEIAAVTRLVALHMRIGEYQSAWTDAAVRRLICDMGSQLEDLFAIHRADVSALGQEHQDISRAHELRARIAGIQEQQDVQSLTSPLDGAEIMRLLDLPAGRRVGQIKDYLTNEVVEGRLDPDDKDGALVLARKMAQAGDKSR